GTENFIILFTVRGSSPNRRAAARSLRPSIRTAWRTRPYSSTPFIPALCQSNAKGYLLPDFYSGGATGISGRSSEGLLLRRLDKHFGVRGGMSGWLARELCPQLIFVGGHFGDYQRLGDAAIKVLNDFTP